MSALKPCPFCGGPGGDIPLGREIYAGCVDGNCPGNGAFDTSQAWNTRIPDPAPVVTNAEIHGTWTNSELRKELTASRAEIERLKSFQLAAEQFAREMGSAQGKTDVLIKQMSEALKLGLVDLVEIKQALLPDEPDVTSIAIEGMQAALAGHRRHAEGEGS